MAPLLQPADCCLLLVDPRARHISRMDPIRQADLTRRLNLLLDAALATAAPIHIAFVAAPPDAEEWAIARRPSPQTHIHGLGAAGSRWPATDLHSAVAAQNRNSLILGGFWLETTVTFLALQALAAGFEVFVLMDAAPASAEASARPAADRLLQAGAVPITTSQLIAEWIETSADADGRSALSLLAST
jgi:isochorismatase family protein